MFTQYNKTNNSYRTIIYFGKSSDKITTYCKTHDLKFGFMRSNSLGKHIKKYQGNL